MKIYQVDSFTDNVFAGNPAAVCLLEKAQDEAWLQNVAREMNLSETAFLLREEDGYRLRWFTPTTEVDLCGHATLASAHILWEQGMVANAEIIRFSTKSGVLTAKWQDGWIELDFPTATVKGAAAPAELVQAIGIVPQRVSKSNGDYLVELETEEQVRKLQPDFVRLAELPVTGLIATAPSADDAYDFVSRYFAPQLGINEDPVTGSAHCGLGPYWQQWFGRDTFTAQQVSARGGVIKVRVAGERVVISGQAVTVLAGELNA